MTFYYFADAYINFNSLVTDLFKIYKTRIWMSAINPASFASPTLGLQAPSGIGPGAVGLGRSAGGPPANTERRQNPQQENQGTFPGGNPSGRPFPSAFNQPFAPERAIVPSNAYSASGFPFSAYAAFNTGSRVAGAPYVPGMMPSSMDAYSSGLPQGADFQAMRARFPSPHGVTSTQDSTGSSLAGQNEWIGAFQGLSMNSR